MDLNPQIIFYRARRLYTEKIPDLIELERRVGKGWHGAAGHPLDPLRDRRDHRRRVQHHLGAP